MNPEKAGNYRVVASPLVSDDLLFVPTRVNPLQAFRFSGDEPKLEWQTADGPDVPTPVTDGSRLYVIRDNGVMLCFDAENGDVVWGPERVPPGTYSASPVLADGRVYVTSEDGVTTVVAAGDRFEVLAENDLEGYTLSSPAISDGQIFIRTESHLYCIGERRSGS
jgi:outer membrane protein assembly factor BamB